MDKNGDFESLGIGVDSALVPSSVLVMFDCQFRNHDGLKPLAFQIVHIKTSDLHKTSTFPGYVNLPPQPEGAKKEISNQQGGSIEKDPEKSTL